MVTPGGGWQAPQSDGRVRTVRGARKAGLYIEDPAPTGIAQWFCAAVTTIFGSMAGAVSLDELSRLLRVGEP